MFNALVRKGVIKFVNHMLRKSPAEKIQKIGFSNPNLLLLNALVKKTVLKFVSDILRKSPTEKIQKLASVIHMTLVKKVAIKKWSFLAGHNFFRFWS